jgi:ubiquinone/menaquinone biosynthesis C-methylase UbiE
VGAQGKVIGLDSSTSMLSVAQSLKPKNLDHVTFMHGDIRNPVFKDNSFDAIYVERLLQISPEPFEILTQLIRILKPGGTLVITEPDWGTMALDPGDKETIRSLISFCTDSFPDGWTGRKLHRYFIESELDTTIEVEPVVMQDFPTIRRAMNFDNFIAGAVQNGKMSQIQADELMDGFQKAGEKGTFFFSYMIYRVIGKKRK